MLPTWRPSAMGFMSSLWRQTTWTFECSASVQDNFQCAILCNGVVTLVSWCRFFGKMAVQCIVQYIHTIIHRRGLCKCNCLLSLFFYITHCESHFVREAIVGRSLSGQNPLEPTPLSSSPRKYLVKGGLATDHIVYWIFPLEIKCWDWWLEFKLYFTIKSTQHNIENIETYLARRST